MGFGAAQLGAGVHPARPRDAEASVGHGVQR